MALVKLNDVSNYVEESLLKIIDINDSKFIVSFNPKIVNNFGKFFKNFIASANTYVLIVPVDMPIEPEKMKEEIILSKGNVNVIILSSFKLKDRVLVVGKD
ncbi:DUF4898 domain-containing protein [Saccharolobus caldissimus]|uniref:Uncharacterized protein n=1 Tax=Saccharolobus caldissimus TaxID=1702097 RepID=A0AAQ4CQP4_9CREN|nr:DUF4898 domain-containing protein [Saccharolobus caldissimus]BDB98125.1 hypothetical protein SACC_11420 [Saccharolobus caldissimus]